MLLSLIGIMIYYLMPTKKSVETISTFSLSPTSPPAQKTPTEPLVEKWQVYANEQFNFSLQIPDKWHVQDYAKIYPNGGTLIAFSPDPLPCDTCTYFRNGYFSLRLFNEKSSPESYILYTQRMKAVGKNKEYQGVKIKEATGVMSANLLAFEHEGWVYEFSLDYNNGSMRIIDSSLMQKIILSISYTGLKFTN